MTSVIKSMVVGAALGRLGYAVREFQNKGTVDEGFFFPLSYLIWGAIYTWVGPWVNDAFNLTAVPVWSYAVASGYGTYSK